MPSGRTYVVDGRKGSDKATGTGRRPFKTINRAAEVAGPGETVLVRAGVYRERVDPKGGGKVGRPVTYAAAPGEEVFIRGSEVFRPEWRPVRGPKGVFRGSLAAVPFGTKAYRGHLDAGRYGDFNPFLWNFNRAVPARPREKELARLREAVARWEGMLANPPEDSSGTQRANFEARLAAARRDLDTHQRSDDPRHPLTLGQVFCGGRPLVQVERLSELHEVPGTWMVAPEGDAILVHFPSGVEKPEDAAVEISVRHAVFSPLARRLGHIHVRGFVLEHAANHFPTWGKGGWPQAGLLSCRSGHHWVIEENVVRYAAGLGIDCGSEGGTVNVEGASADDDKALHDQSRTDSDEVGHHLIRSNWIVDNGHCGLAGIRHRGTQVLGNAIERNNRTGWTSPWWEFGGIKFHFFFDGLIEGNLVRDNDAHGIWLDNQWRGSRVTRNVIVNNLWSGVNVELGRGPVLIDNNVIACTRQGDGVYGHDASDVTIAHNLIYANANFGVWFAYCTPRVKPEDGCWDITTLNNMILGNRAGAVALPMPFEAAGRNVSEGNLLMGGGEYLDEGSGPMPPLFQLTNKTHCGQMALHCGKEITPQTPETVARMFTEALDRAKIPQDARPNLAWWKEHYCVPLDLWRAVLGSDRQSRVLRTIKDGLQSRVVAWECDLDETVRQVRCEPVAGVDKDFLGRPMPKERPLPGPFQSVEIGRNHITLWPVRGVATACVLP